MSKKVKLLMEDYFSDSKILLKNAHKPIVKLDSDTPIQVKNGEWEVKKSPERFFKIYTFSDRARLIDFINEIMHFEDERGHHGSVNIDHLDVVVEVYTKDLDRVTNRDKEYCMGVDDIFEDCSYYEY
jgi:pterin-4a-carbinolamine dehydratase